MNYAIFWMDLLPMDDSVTSCSGHLEDIGHWVMQSEKSHLLILLFKKIFILEANDKWVQIFQNSYFHLKAQLWSLAKITFFPLEVTGSLHSFFRNCLLYTQMWVTLVCPLFICQVKTNSSGSTFNECTNVKI